MAKGRLGRRREHRRGRRWKRLRWTSIEAKVRPWLFDAVSRFGLAAAPCYWQLLLPSTTYSEQIYTTEPSNQLLQIPLSVCQFSWSGRAILFSIRRVHQHTWESLLTRRVQLPGPALIARGAQPLR